MSKKSKSGGLVYSTESGKINPQNQRPAKKGSFSGLNAPKDGIVRVKRETKGRKGKGVSLIDGLSLNDHELKDLARELKQKCGTGGTVNNGVIEIQGDHRDKLVEALIAKGYKAKKAGG